MNLLEQMGYIVKPITQVFTPFDAWTGSQLQDWKVTLQLLTAGDQIDIARRIAEDAPTVLVYTTKVQLLAKALKAINGEPILTSDQLDVYREAHKSPEFTSIDYILLYLKKLPEPAIDAMIYAYSQLQDIFAARLLGKPLPDALKVAKVEPLTDQEEPQNEETKTSVKTSD